jgi:hypothetical protein
MQKPNTSIVLHQLLHGYEDGHSLIGSSINLGSDIKRLIGVLSDMSGPNMQKGFEEYITGYPLSSIGMYALAKTWYAFEMPRPGSVWTHTLLIPFSDLPKFESSAELLIYFRRPNAEVRGKKTFSDYNEPISVVSDNDRGANDIELGITESILRVLYQNSDNSIILKSDNSKIYEEIILSIWLQQWPRLRRNFSFCTGAIYPRNIENRSFDLQACPGRIESSVDLNTNYHVLDPLSIKSSNNESRWSLLAAQDIQHPSPLREYLRIYGADSSSTRASFVRLVNSYIYLTSFESKRTIHDLVDTLSSLFPLDSDAEQLKVDIFLNQSDFFRTSIPSFKEEEILLELSTTENFNSLNYKKLKFLDRFLYLYHNTPAHSITLLKELLKHDINVWGEQALKRIAEAVNESDFQSLVDLIDKPLAFALVSSQNSKLLYSEFFWRLYKKDHLELFSILLRLDQSNGLDWIRIIDILIKIDSDVASQLAGDPTIDLTNQILNWSNYYNNSDINYSWQSLIRNKPNSVIKWLNSVEQIKDHTIRLVTSVLNPNSKEVIGGGTVVWIQTISRLQSEKSHVLVEVSAFALALAFNRPDKHYLELVSRTFETVYNSLKTDTLNYNYWWPIEIHTKRLSWYNDWDKCKKLIDALFLNFTEVRWTKSMVQFLFFNEEIQDRVWLRFKNKHS